MTLLITAPGCDSDTSAGDSSRGDATVGDTDSDIGDTAAQDAVGDAPSDAAGDASDSGGQGDGQSSDCPLYQSRCGGVCIPTATDPDNCGGCGVTCDETQVCSGGTCTDSCMAGLNICDRKCVDYESDNDHCGACGNACPSGQGCVKGTCEEAADLGDRADACVGGGPLIDFGDAVTVERQCSGDLATRTFRWALCSCEDITTNATFYADAYDSSVGPYRPGGEGGGIASNGVINSNSGFEITGTLWASDDDAVGTAVRVNSSATIGQRLHAGSAVQFGSGTTIGGDAYVNGDVARNLSIGGTLHAPNSAAISGNVTYANLQHGPVNVASPCDACGVDERIPVAEIVAARTGTNNDNAAIGLDADILAAGEADGARRIDLPCGHYYLSEITTSQAATIVAHGNTALYIGGDINASSRLTITLTPDAQLDVFVAGSVSASGLKLGSPNYPALFRMYIGGDEGFRTSAGPEIGGYLYAVPGGIRASSGMEVFGGVYAQSVESNAGDKYHFDRRINVVGQSCPDPEDPTDPVDPTEPDAGTTPEPDAGTTPDPDAGTTPDPDAGTPPEPGVCGVQTDACESSDDCCSPLVCGAGGECVLMECKPGFSECTSHDECCSNACDGVCIIG